jgi:glycogen operon protein
MVAGDECRRTQQGNNNAWCQDNAVSWFDWRLIEKSADLVRFVAALVQFRLGNPAVRRRTFLRGGSSSSGVVPDVEWFSPEGVHIDWHAADASLTVLFGAPASDELASGPDVAAGGNEGTSRHVLIFAHAGSLPRSFQFPRSDPLRALSWRLFVHTGHRPPDDVYPDGDGPPVDASMPLVLPERGLVCLVADPPVVASQAPLAPQPT